MVVGRAGFEPAKVKPTDLQSVLVGRLSISPITKSLFQNELHIVFDFECAKLNIYFVFQKKI